jgi:DNA topoisomerase-1
VQAGLGRFGPYVVHDKGKGEKDYRSLKAEDDVLAIGLNRALDLLAQPKRGRGGRTALRDLGTPEGSSEAIQLFDGPYGLYVKQGKINASLPEGTSAESLTPEQAMELLAAKASTGKAGSRGRSTTRAAAPKATPAKAAGAKAAAGSKAAAGAKASRTSAAATPRKAPATTKSGRLRASPVRVIRPAGNG